MVERGPKASGKRVRRVEAKGSHRRQQDGEVVQVFAPRQEAGKGGAEYFINVGPIDETEALRICTTLQAIEQANPKSEIAMHINSYGGGVYPAMLIAEQIKMISNPVTTICEGWAMSGGALILAAGDKRLAWENSTIMIHGIQVTDKHESTSMPEYEQSYERLRDLNIHFLKRLAEYCDKPFDEIKKFCEKDTYLTAEEAKKLGMVDEVIHWKKKKPGADRPVEKNVFSKEPILNPEPVGI